MLTGPYAGRLRDYHPLWSDFPDAFGWAWVCNPSVLPQPRPEGRFGLSSAFARRY